MEEPSHPDHYFVLEIDQTATEREITIAYRKLSLKWHPDKNGGDQSKALPMMIKVREETDSSFQNETRIPCLSTTWSSFSLADKVTPHS